MLSGRLPFVGDSMAQLMFKIANEEAADVRTINPAIPEGLWEVLKRAIEKKVAFVPGASFHPRGGGENTMRLNFSYSAPNLIREGVARLGLTLKELIKEKV